MDALESLRLQALRSLSFPRKDSNTPVQSNQQVIGQSPARHANAQGSSKPGTPSSLFAIDPDTYPHLVQQPNDKLRIDKGGKKHRRKPKQHNQSAKPNSSQIFEQLQSKLMIRTGLAKVDPSAKKGPPPMPLSFASFSAGPIVKSALGKPSIVIELDTTDDGEMPVDELEPGEIIPSPFKEASADCNNRSASIKKELEEIESSIKQNSEVIKDAIQKHNAMKKQLQQHKSLISRGHATQRELTKKKSDLLRDLLKNSVTKSVRTKDSNLDVNLVQPYDFDLFDAQPCNEEVHGLPLIKNPSISTSPNHRLEQDVSFGLSEIKRKRKLEMEELQQQLNKVQSELNQSKLVLLTQKKVEAQKKKQKKGLKKDKSLLIIRDMKLPNPITSSSETPYEDTFVEFCGHLCPKSVFDEFSKHYTKTSADLARSSKNEQPFEYESPLRWFRSSLFHPAFLDFVQRNGLLSITFTNKIDPYLPFCEDEFTFGCTRQNCKFQHMNSVHIPDNELLQQVIQRLISFNSETDTTELLAFIHGKLTERNLTGAPVVSIISELLRLRDEIAKDDRHLVPLSIREPSAQSTKSKTLKPYIKGIKELAGRYFFCISDRITNFDLNNSSRYFEDEDEESSFVARLSLEFASKTEAELLSTIPEILDTVKKESELLITLDYLSFLGYPLINLSSPSTRIISFLSAISFEEKCRLFPTVVPDLKTSDQTGELVFCLAKASVDHGNIHAFLAIVLAIFKSQMTLNDDLVPTALLCDLPIPPNADDQCRLLLFYLEVMQTDSYPSEMFMDYPWDHLVNTDYWLCVSWDRQEYYEEALALMCEFYIRNAISLKSTSAEILAHNIVRLRIRMGENIQTAIESFNNLPEIMTFYTTASPPSSSTVLGKLAAIKDAIVCESTPDGIMLSEELSTHFKDLFIMYSRQVWPHVYETDALVDIKSMFSTTMSSLRTTRSHLIDIIIARIIEDTNTFVDTELVVPRKLKVDQSLNSVENLCATIVNNPTDLRSWIR